MKFGVQGYSWLVSALPDRGGPLGPDDAITNPMREGESGELAADRIGPRPAHGPHGGLSALLVPVAPEMTGQRRNELPLREPGLISRAVPTGRFRTPPDGH